MSKDVSKDPGATYREFGTIVKRGNALQARYRRFGKAHYKTFRGPRAHRDAQLWLARERGRVLAGDEPRRNRTGFRSYCKEIIPRYRDRVRGSTWKAVAGHIRHAGAYFAETPVSSIGFKEADEYLAFVRRRSGIRQESRSLSRRLDPRRASAYPPGKRMLQVVFQVFWGRQEKEEVSAHPSAFAGGM